MGKSLQARINQAALLHNFYQVKELTAGKWIIAMVKANAYGHGLVAVAKILATADAFGVANIEEAIILRQAGIKQRIIVMEGFSSARELQDIVTWQLETIIHHPLQLDILAKHIVKKVQAWVKINTGMNRLGFTIENCLLNFAKIQQYCEIMGVLTHFSAADELHSGKTKQQIALFTKLLDNLQVNYPSSLANSAAILAWPEAHGDWVRPGLMLYGVSPFSGFTGSDFKLQPVMQLVTKIIAINLVHKGEAIGYQSRFICPEDMLVGVIAIGYADGYLSTMPDGMPVLVNGYRAKVVGKVSMDMATIDLRGCHNVKIGDEVILWGAELPVEEVAKGLGVIPYALLTAVGSRVTRVYTDVTVNGEIPYCIN